MAGGRKEREIRSKNREDRGKRKQRRDKEGSSAVAYYPFINEAAATWYENEGSKKTFIPERGIDLPEVMSPFVRQVLIHYGWASSLDDDTSKNWFARHPGPSVVQWVQEFYANLKFRDDSDGQVVMVRGKEILFNPSTINSYYGLEAYDDIECWYMGTNKNTVDWDSVMATIARPGTQWILNNDGQRKAIPASGLSRDHHVLLHFLSAKLIPGTHVSTINKDRALLLYALVRRENINIGEIIYSAVMEAARAKGKPGLAMPSMITGLCQLHNVPQHGDEMFRDPKRVLDYTAFYQIHDGPAPMDEGERAPRARDPPPPRPITRPLTMPEKIDLLLERQEKMEKRFEQRFDLLEARERERDERHRVDYDHIIQSFGALHTMISPLLAPYGVAPVPMPPRPFPPHTGGPSSSAAPLDEEGGSDDEDYEDDDFDED